MIYKMLPKLHPSDVQILICIDDDNISRTSCTEHDQQYLAWLAEGNQPEPSEEQQ